MIVISLTPQNHFISNLRAGAFSPHLPYYPGGLAVCELPEQYAYCRISVLPVMYQRVARHKRHASLDFTLTLLLTSSFLILPPCLCNRARSACREGRILINVLWKTSVSLLLKSGRLAFVRIDLTLCTVRSCPETKQSTVRTTRKLARSMVERCSSGAGQRERV